MAEENVLSVDRSAETSADKNTVLTVQDLRTWYELRKLGMIRTGYVKALDGVTFDINPGEAVTVVGESGSGKSTLAKTLLGLVPPHSGEIFFAGRQFSGNKNKEVLNWLRANVGFVQQDPYGALPPFMSIRRILREPLAVNGVAAHEHEQRVRQALEEVRLFPVDDFINKFPHMLSGGQQQRVVIARALVLGPSLIVADEPVSMLDASVRVEILQLLRRIQEARELGVIYITHDLSTVRYFSEHAMVMYAARLVEKAPVKELIRNPLHPYAVALLAATSDPDPQNAHIIKDVPPGEPPSLVNPPSGCRFHPRCVHFMEGLCDVEEPPPFEPQPGHTVECWLYREGMKGVGEQSG